MKEVRCPAWKASKILAFQMYSLIMCFGVQTLSFVCCRYIARVSNNSFHLTLLRCKLRIIF